MGTLTRGYTFVAHTLGRAAHVEGEFDNFLANINTRICADGTLHFTGTAPLTLEYDDPYLEIADTQTSGKTWRIKGSVDTTAWLDIDYYESLAWHHLIRLPYVPGTDRAEFNVEAQVHTLIAKDAIPHVTFEGTEPSAEYYKIEENTGVLNVRFWDDPAWDILMTFNDDTSVDILVPLKVDDIGELTADAGVTITDPVTLQETLIVNGVATLNGTPAIVNDKCITMANLGLELICILTFNNLDMEAGRGVSGEQYVYKGITDQIDDILPIFLPVISDWTLTTVGGMAGVDVRMVAIPTNYWRVCIQLHNYVQHIANSVEVEVYQWTGNPADHTP